MAKTRGSKKSSVSSTPRGDLEEHSTQNNDGNCTVVPNLESDQETRDTHSSGQVDSQLAEQLRSQAAQINNLTSLVSQLLENLDHNKPQDTVLSFPSNVGSATRSFPSHLADQNVPLGCNEALQGQPGVPVEVHQSPCGHTSPKRFLQTSSPIAEHKTNGSRVDSDLYRTCGEGPEPNRTSVHSRHGSCEPPQGYSEYMPEVVTNVGPIHHSSNKLVINQITPPTFNGDRSQARNWLRRYEHIMEMNGYDNVEKFIKVDAYLTGEGAQWLTSARHFIRVPDWYLLRGDFIKHFCGIDGQDFLRRKLQEARQKPEDHPSTYFARILDVCKEFKPNMSDQELIRKVREGLTTSEYNHLADIKAPEDWTLEWIREIFSRRKHRPERASLEENSSPSQRPKKPAITKPKDLSTWICFNCDQAGHVISDCPKPVDEAVVKAKKENYRTARAAKKSESQNGVHIVERSRAANAVQNPCFSQAQVAVLACDQIAKPTLSLTLNGEKIEGRFDSGADISVIPGNVATTLGLNIQPWNLPPLNVVGANKAQPIGMASVLATYGEMKRALLVAVMPDNVLKEPLWGIDVGQAFSITIEFNSPSNGTDPNNTNVGDVRPVRVYMNRFEPLTHPIDKVQLGELNDEDRTRVEQTLVANADVFSVDDYDIGRTSTIKHRIFLRDEIPVYKNYYRVPFQKRDEMQAQVIRMTERGVIRPSKSPYGSPVFFVDKDHGKALRLVADYRALNAKTVPDRMPMPHPDEVFGLLAGTSIFTKLDITSMFNQIEVDERDIEKTAITTPFGLFECPLLPFGLINAPATAVRLMNIVLDGLIGHTCFVYFDDIIVFARDLDQLVQRCTEVLQRLRSHNLKLKPAKCQFAMKSVSYLGHVISEKGVDIDPRRIRDVQNFPTPKDHSDVRSFHGLCSYSRKFIKDFSRIATPLTRLTSNQVPFVWSVEAEAAFEELRGKLIRAPTLVKYDLTADHELRTDASSYAIGAVLYQKHKLPEQSGVVLYYSKTLDVHQRRYSATERELLAAFRAITDLKHYLIGKRFTLVTDHEALSSIHGSRDPHHRLARWIAQLQCYEFDVVYKRGSENLDADCMSRFVPIPSPTEEDRSVMRAICHVTNEASGESQERSELEEDTSGVDLRTDQRRDSFCNKYIGILEASDLSESEKAEQARGFTIQDGLLYRSDEGQTPTLVIPESRRAAILLACHDSPLAGHLGFTRTYNFIRQRFYWPKMRKQIKHHVASCISCQKRKALNKRTEGFTKPLPIAEDFFDTMGIDLMVKLPKSNGYNTILVCTDNLSKYVITVPLKDEKASSIIHAVFNHVIAKHGCPRLIISDRGSNISGEESRDFYRYYGIVRNLTTAYHPQSNGQTERFNRTVAASLTAYVAEQQDKWVHYLQAVTFAYNTSVHSVTRASPFELIFNRRPRLPIENVLERNEFIDPSRPIPGQLSSETVRQMKEYILKNQAANKRRLDANLAPTTFKEGDLVLVKRPTLVKGGATKFSYTYIGPYKIHKRIDDLTFQIAYMRGRCDPQTVHVCHLKRYTQRQCPVQDPIVDPCFVPEVSDDQISIRSSDTASAHESDEEFEPQETELLSPPTLEMHMPTQESSQ